jgi:hypothetical protein
MTTNSSDGSNRHRAYASSHDYAVDNDQHSHPSYRTPSVQHHQGGVQRATISTDRESGERTTEAANIGQHQKHTVRATDEGSVWDTARTSTGRPVPRSEITSDTLVHYQGMEVSVDALVKAGAMHRNVDGTFSLAGDAPTGITQQPQQKAAEAQPEAFTNAADIATDEAVGAIAANTSATDQLSLINEAIATGNLNEAVIGRLASQAGVQPSEVRQVADNFVKALYGQADAAVSKATGFSLDQVVEWARENDPRALQDAMKSQATERTTRGYVDLGQRMIADMERVDPQSILDACASAGIPARQTQAGRIVLNIAGHGQFDFKTALAHKLIRLG